jgi:two-component system chemotaxis response regulator CheB
MSKQLRVLIADDSHVTRRLVMESINSEEDMAVVALAADGVEALNMFRAHNPDVLLLDVEMPIMNGLDALKSIRQFNESVPVIMFSSLTVKGGEAILDALTAGANDYVAKPTSTYQFERMHEYLLQELIPKLRLWGTRHIAEHQAESLNGPHSASIAAITEQTLQVR